ncbi:uncharacterized protein LOC115212137 [Octopus sinensis]|uniref:ATP-dependent DNA helicase n=1 Tax=Octopus sinensis TaxID=2607531 RepID=A0A6P7SFV7_9MOLL|nr:uncharacterized protein LOC115212137 [Octopus sinensis]
MSHKGAFEALDRLLQDLRRISRLMGGLTVLLAGDFRQTLLVIPKGTRADEVNVSIKSSYLWSKVRKLKLSTNMRVELGGDARMENFCGQLMDIGNSAVIVEQDGKINLPFGNLVSNIHELLARVFSNLNTQFKDHCWLRKRAILAPKNVAVDGVNNHLLEQLPGDRRTYK